MGIKFLCPNGHKLHVKAFLSGKKAICPKCGVRVVVPAADASVLSDQSYASGAGDSTILAGESAIVASKSTHSAAGQSDDDPTDSGVATLPASGTSATASSDPIDDAPSAVWYVRPATGGQFGPASGEIMRAWISEGRVGASSLVWRAGWPEWRAAAGIFPQLGSLLATPGVSVAPPTLVATANRTASHAANGAEVSSAAPLPVGQVAQTVAAPVGPEIAPSPLANVPALGPGMRKKRRDTDLSLIASVILLLISIILVAVLIVVWRSQSSAGDNPNQESERAPETSSNAPASSVTALA